MSQKIIFSGLNPSSVPLSQDKPQRDLFKALREGGVDPSIFPSLNLTPPAAPLHLQIISAADQGNRKDMEDAHFHTRLPEGYLLGIFDGHGEKGVIANQAALTFQTCFSDFFQTHSHDFKNLFKQICSSIQSKIVKNMGGSTALVCYFNPVSHRLYISNLGDSKAKLFRRQGDMIQCLPISIHRDWTSPKDVERVKKVFDEQTFTTWSQNAEAKKRYFPLPMMGINVSRSLGDLSMQIEGKTAISQNPRTTCIQLQENDLLIMGCDGLWDFVTDQELINNLLTPSWESPDLARLIVNYALKTSKDNVSVICAHAKTEIDDANDLDSTQPDEDSE